MDTNQNNSKFRQSFLKLPFKEFTTNYESEFVDLMYNDISLAFTFKQENLEVEGYDFEYLGSNEHEATKIEQAINYLNKSNRVLHELIEHRNKQQREFKPSIVSILQTNTHKTIFLQRRLEQLGYLIDLRKILDKDFSEIKITKSNLIDGKKLNISERYKIADETLDLFDTINKKNISATEKHILLAHILGCSQQVARELFNGTQQKRTPVRENLINDYLKKLK